MATGLEQQIEARRTGTYLDRHEKVTYSYISKIINKSPRNTTNRIKNNTLTVTDAIKIYEELDFKPRNSYETFKYLFTEQKED